jgi:hypothetical protein
MNCHERRKLEKLLKWRSKSSLGLSDGIRTQIFYVGTDFFWFPHPPGFFSMEEWYPYQLETNKFCLVKDDETQAVELRGPFKSAAEAEADMDRFLRGFLQCEITDAGTWDPAWEKPQ